MAKKFDTESAALIASIRAQMLDDLKRSGLSPEDAARLKLSPLTAEWCDENFGQPRHAYRIPYFDLHGRPTDFYRVRFVQSHRNDDLRYMQPANTGSALYFPPLLNGRTWAEVAADPSIPILITEGEKKAAAACKAGLACIGLGGVWSFKSVVRFQDLLPEFNDFVLAGRQVEICFDTDVMTKREVHNAMVALASTLFRLKQCSPKFVFLKPVDGSRGKTGLDDYLLINTAEDFAALQRTGYSEAQAFETLNNRVAFIADMGAYYDFQKHRLMEQQHARLALGPLATIKVLRNKAEMDVPAFDVWHMHPNRREAESLVYEPGNPVLMTKDGNLNSWQKPTLQPKRGEVKRWRDHVAHIMGKDAYTEWFMKWLAYPLQHPGAKLYSATFVHGQQQGAGKNLVVEPFVRIAYASNYIHIENSDLQSEFNTYAANKQFGVIDEVYVASAHNRKDSMGAFKSMITRERFELNEKYQKKRTVQDRINYYITSNHADALALEETDRRFFVIEAPDEQIKYGEELADYIEHHGGDAAILYYLLNNVDTSDFKPRGPALPTSAREKVIGLSADLCDIFVRNLVEDPLLIFERDPILSKSGRELFSASDLYHILREQYHDAPHSITPKTIGHRLGQFVREDLIELRLAQKSGAPRTARLYAVFNRAKWSKASNVQWHEEYFR